MNESLYMAIHILGVVVGILIALYIGYYLVKKRIQNKYSWDEKNETT